MPADSMQITVPSVKVADLGITTTPSRITWVGCSSGLDDSALVDHLHVPADPGILVDDRPLDDRIGADAEGGRPSR